VIAPEACDLMLPQLDSPPPPKTPTTGERKKAHENCLRIQYRHFASGKRFHGACHSLCCEQRTMKPVSTRGRDASRSIRPSRTSRHNFLESAGRRSQLPMAAKRICPNRFWSQSSWGATSFGLYQSPHRIEAAQP